MKNTHTILGGNWQIGEELARELKRTYSSTIKIVGRQPRKVNDTDIVFSADLSIMKDAATALQGSHTAYFTLGLPMNSDLWEEDFALITKNVIEACKIHGTKLVFLCIRRMAR